MPDSLPKTNDFEEIRPYHDSEVIAVLKNLLEDPIFHKVIHYVFPKWDKKEIWQLLKDVETVKEFQKRLMYPAVHAIAEKTITQLSNSGFDTLSKNESYLYISNHRDIILDSAIFNVMLFEAGMDTCEVAIGSNLLIQPWLVDLVKLNKNFIVHREIPSKKLYEYSLRLSNYIRNAVTVKSSSVWIAQKEGRTKDGNDITQAGLLKMLSISGKGNIIDDFKRLNFVPMAISYEYEPCDHLKAREIAIRTETGNYKKQAGEDLQSMIDGITSFKGRFHMSLGTTLKEKLETLNLGTTKNDLMKELATLINKEIYALYRLWPTNYIAFDLLNNSGLYEDQYTKEDKQKFLEHVEATIVKTGQKHSVAKEILLNMYANPVKNKFNSTPPLL